MKRKHHFQSFLSVWHKRLLIATLDMHDMRENVRQSNMQLSFLQTISLKGVCHVILGCFEKITSFKLENANVEFPYR